VVELKGVENMDKKAPAWENWTADMKGKFSTIAGNMMEELGYVSEA